MKRDIRRLQEEKFNVLVIGGGIHGVMIARESALKGYRTAIIEMKDFGHATSANSLKILHGGLRYLQQADIRRMRQSIRSRKIFQQISPHLIDSVPFVIPTYGHGIMGKESMAVALKINDLISWDRNREIFEESYISNGKLISKEEMLRISPGIEKEGLNGGAVWYECVVNNTERLTLECLLNAEQYHLVAANYVKAQDFIIDNNKVLGVNVQDHSSSEEFEICADVLVNAAGPWFNDIIKLLPKVGNSNQQWSKAANIIVNKKIFPDYAVGISGIAKYDDQNSVINKGKRLYFFVPWQGQTMIGTSYKYYHGSVNDCRPQENDIMEIVEEVNSIYPDARLEWEDVTYYHTGILPAISSDSTTPTDVQLEKHSAIIDHKTDLKLDGLLSVKSVKFTTAPVIAEEVVKRISQKIQSAHTTNNSVTKTASVGSKTMNNRNSDIEKRLTNIYGARALQIINLMIDENQLEELVCKKPLITKAELSYLIQEEMVLTLEDVVMRRTGIGMLACPDEDSLKLIADFMAKELSWDESKKFDELHRVLNHFSLLKRNKHQAVETA